MKRLLLAFVLVFSAILFSCEEKVVIPDCELNHYGNVTVKNSTGYNVWVDVTWGNVSINYEKLLYNGGTHKYNEIPSGSIEIWVTFDNVDWYYEYENLSDCEAMTYTWYLTSIKSTCPFELEVNGKMVTPTLKIKE